MTQEVPPKIFACMVAIMQDVEAIAKSQKNTAQGFNFRGIDDCYHALHPLFSKHGVLCIPVIESVEHENYLNGKGNRTNHTRLTVNFRFTAIDGSYVEARGAGEAADFGDKSTAKALSLAHKYALIQTFLIPVWQIEDGDADSTVDPRAELERIEAAARAAVMSGNNNGEGEMTDKDTARLEAKRQEVAEAAAARAQSGDDQVTHVTPTAPVAQPEAPADPAPAKAKRTRAAKPAAETPTPVETPATTTASVPVPAPAEEDQSPFGDPETPATGWQGHKIVAVKLPEFQGKTIGELTAADVERIHRGWAAKHPIETLRAKGEHFAVEALAFIEAYKHHFPKPA